MQHLTSESFQADAAEDWKFKQKKKSKIKCNIQEPSPASNLKMNALHYIKTLIDVFAF